MTITEHRLTIFQQLEELSEASLFEVEKLIAKLKVIQKSDDISELGVFFEDDVGALKLAKQRDSEIENGEVIALSHTELMARLRHAH